MQTKTVNQVAASVVTAMRSGMPSRTPQTRAGLPDSDVADAVNRVFALFQATWPRKFSSIWPTADAVRISKRSWLIAFRDCRHLTPETIQSGLSRVREEKWPPDNPGEFLQFCHVQPEDINAPISDRAFSEAVHKSYPYAAWSPWSHKCVYWAAIWTGQSDLSERQQFMRQQFDREYQSALDQHSQLSDPPRGWIEAKTQQQSHNERIAAAEYGFAKIKEILSGRAS